MAMLWVLGCQAIGTAAPETRYLVVRYDDYAPRMVDRAGRQGIELERRLFELFDRYDAKLVVGVIPEPVSGDIDGHDPYLSDPQWLSRADDPWVTLLRTYVQKGVVEPALHGYQHKRNTPPGHRPGEFKGRPLDWQSQAIATGRDKLAAAVGRPIDVFVPPWNAWDAHTAEALDTAGFTWLSPDLHHAGLPDVAIKVAPQTTADPREAAALIEQDPPLPGGSVIVLVLHPFSFSDDGSFREVASLLERVQGRPEWKCVGLDDLPDAPAAQWQRRFRAAVTLADTAAKLDDMIGAGVWSEPVPAVLLPASELKARASSLTLRLYVYAAIVGAIAALLGWACAGIAARWRSGPVALFAAGALATAVLIAGAVLIVQAGYHVRGIRLQAILAALGATLGAGVVAARMRAKRPPSGHGGVATGENAGTMLESAP